MQEAATSECVAITETSHYRAGVTLRYYVYAQSRTGNLVTGCKVYVLAVDGSKDDLFPERIWNVPFVIQFECGV